MNNERKRGGKFAQLLRSVQSAFKRGSEEHDARPAKAASAVYVVPARILTAGELINEGLRQRRENGVAAAQPFFETAAQLEPNSHVPFFMLGNVASELGDLDTAVRHYARARDLQPSDHVVRYNLGLNELWRGYVQSAIEELRAACSLNPAYLQAQSTHLWALHNSDRVGPEEIAAATHDWGARFALQHPEAVSPGPVSGADPSRVLRVGFVSGDFRTHSVAHFFEPVASARDRAGFKYVFYSTASHHDAVTERLRAQADVWRDVAGLCDDALIELIRTDDIDILVDLAGHTDLNRLSVFARRAAPVQVSYLGYPDSTGLPTMDYRITDSITDPEPAADAWHSERLLRLPNSQWCFRPFGALAAPGPLPARDVGFITFGSFNNLSKVSDTVLHWWSQILLRLPTSRLRVTRIRSPQRTVEILALLRERGIAADRVDCVPYGNDAPYGLQYAGVDIALDPYPYNGVTTTCESLYFGLPVISLHGPHGVSRSGLSILGSLGLRELVAATPEQYIEIAVALALDLPRLESLRALLRSRFEQSSLRDERRFAANFEALLRTAWRQENAAEAAAAPDFKRGPTMVETTELPMIDDVRIVVPNSIDLITPYVLREQLDFFENELRFVRGLLQPGQKVIDIGANYGVYTLPMARKVGPDGHVWAFEPASSTAQFLKQSITANAFRHVTLEQKAISISPGSALLSLQRDSELNAIVHGRAPSGDSETVAMVTLDECMERYCWTDIELIKIDAEGEENNIVKGGLRFFANLAPLVQYELRKDATNVNVELIREFAALGYDSYRLVPGLNLLVPFDLESQHDPYLLNLFCCKAARAERLAARGVLVHALDVSGTGAFVDMNADSGDTDQKYHWSIVLAHLPYAAPLSSAWRSAEEGGESTETIRALSFYACSRDAALSPVARFRALEVSFLALKAECHRAPALLRLASLARVAHDYGARAVSVNALKQLLEYIRHAGIDPNEPFLSPLERFDSIPAPDTVSWVVAAILEQLEKSEYYSTFYAGAAALERLEDIQALGFASPEMQRRLDLVRLRIDHARQRGYA